MKRKIVLDPDQRLSPAERFQRIVARVTERAEREFAATRWSDERRLLEMRHILQQSLRALDRLPGQQTDWDRPLNGDCAQTVVDTLEECLRVVEARIERQDAVWRRVEARDDA
jgi:hypothetical protein